MLCFKVTEKAIGAAVTWQPQETENHIDVKKQTAIQQLKLSMPQQTGYYFLPQMTFKCYKVNVFCSNLPGEIMYCLFKAVKTVVVK